MSELLVHAAIYRHYKGAEYAILLIAQDSNNHANRETVVVYMSLSAPYTGSINTRWMSEFLEEVELPTGERVPRFSYVGPLPLGTGPA